MDTGAKRRMASIRFSKKAEVSRATATDDTTQEQRDALVTVALSDALVMWQAPDIWQPLPQKDADTALAVSDADPVEAAIDSLTDDQVVLPLTVVLEQLKANPEHAGDKAVMGLSTRALSARLSKREDWKSCKHRVAGELAARLYRPGGCPCDAQQELPAVTQNAEVPQKGQFHVTPVYMGEDSENADFAELLDFAELFDGQTCICSGPDGRGRPLDPTGQCVACAVPDATILADYGPLDADEAAFVARMEAEFCAP